MGPLPKIGEKQKNHEKNNYNKNDNDDVDDENISKNNQKQRTSLSAIKKNTITHAEI